MVAHPLLFHIGVIGILDQYTVSVVAFHGIINDGAVVRITYLHSATAVGRERVVLYRRVIAVLYQNQPIIAIVGGGIVLHCVEVSCIYPYSILRIGHERVLGYNAIIGLGYHDAISVIAHRVVVYGVSIRPPQQIYPIVGRICRGYIGYHPVCDIVKNDVGIGIIWLRTRSACVLNRAVPYDEICRGISYVYPITCTTTIDGPVVEYVWVCQRSASAQHSVCIVEISVAIYPYGRVRERWGRLDLGGTSKPVLAYECCVQPSQN